MRERRVNLFVVGAMRAGTTSFMHFLSQQSNIYACPIKEPHFFMDELPKSLYTPGFFNLNSYLKKAPLKPLHIAKVNRLEDYELLFAAAEEEHTYLAEASTAYLHSPDSAGKIQQYNAEAKIVIMLRDPLERMISHYKMDVGLGRVTKSFQQIAEEEIKKYEMGNLPWYSCLSMSFYDAAIKRYQEHFKEVLILFLEDFKKEPKINSITISEFLKIDINKISFFENKNSSKEIRTKTLLYWSRKLNVKPLFSKILPIKLRHYFFRRIVSTKNRRSLEITAQTVSKLQTIFEKENTIYYSQNTGIT
ncbi:MAG: sulfotransferase [Flavobacteriaceae bacterium]